jgi:hypothetical protein
MSPNCRLQPPRKHQKMETIPGSSMVEHSAVNRRVASSNLARGANLFSLNQLKSVVEHSAFDRMPGVCEVKSGLQVGEATALFCNQSDVNNCCHKNVIVASHSWPSSASGAAWVAPPEFAI